jgi:ABC-2 type transport system permease protein
MMASVHPRILPRPEQPMHVFWEIMRQAIRRQFTYRAATLAGLATNVFFGLIRAIVMIALYGDQQSVNGMTLQDAVTFTGLSQAIIAFLMIFGWYEVMASVYSGEIASDLLRPLGYFRYWMAIEAGRSVVNLLLRGVSIMVVYALVVDITVPASLTQWLLLAVALVLAWVVGFAWRFLVNLAAFWTPNAAGIGRFAFGMVWSLSGFFMPLRLYPDWFAALCRATPFPAMVNTPIEVYLGLVSGAELAAALANQAFWAMVLILAGQLVLRLGVRRLVIQGG